MKSLAEQKAFFEKEGYLVAEGVLSEDELAECREEIERLHRLSAELESAGDPGSSNFQREPYAKGANRPDGLPVLRKIENTRDTSPFFRDLSVHPRLLRVLGGLLGPDLLLFRSTLMLKPAFHGSAHAPHQDSAYWPIEPPALVTVSIALNDATTENGCFKVIPCSHTWQLKDWGHIAQAQDAEPARDHDLQGAHQIEVPLKAGDALFFHSLIVHGSGPNRSPNPRNTALYAYFPPHVRYVPGKGGTREKTYPVACGLDGRKTFTLEATGQRVQAGPVSSSSLRTKE